MMRHILSIVLLFGTGASPAAAAAPSTDEVRARLPFAGQLIIYPSAFATRQEGSMYRDRIFGRRGILFVRENRRDPDSKTIGIGFWVLPSTALRPRAPIVYLMGGPGHANIDVWREPSRFAQLARLRAISDVILFDQRGSGSPSESMPSLQCPEPFAFPLEQAWQSRRQYVSGFEQHIKKCSGEMTVVGIDIRGYSSEESASDLDELRAALGYAKLNIWGYSYGSFLARTFINLFPNSVERVVIGGNMAERFLKPSNPAIQAFQKLANGFVTDNGIAVAADPDLAASLDKARTMLRTSPVLVDVVRPDRAENAKVALGLYDLNFQLVWALVSPTADWPPIRDAIHDMAAGNFRWLAERTVLWRLGKHRSLLDGKLNGLLISCNAMRDALTLREIASAQQTDPFQGEFGNGPLPEACVAFKNVQLPVAKPWTRTAVETLYYNGEDDPQTPLPNAYEALRLSERAELVIIKGASHFVETPTEAFDAFAGKPIVPGRIRFVEPKPPGR